MESDFGSSFLTNDFCSGLTVTAKCGHSDYLANSEEAAEGVRMEGTAAHVF